jgi:DNA-directed RNA polymerase specialized sigma24 family protein
MSSPIPERDGGVPGERPEPGSRKFSTTRWSLILAASQGSTAEAREALSSLCRLYWYPLYAFTRHQGYSPEDAQDSVQGFFTQLLEKNQLAAVDRQRGRFRCWLLASLKHFLANEWDRTRAEKRGGGQRLISIDGERAEGRYGLEPAHDLTPERLYERHWALALLEHVLATLADECARLGKQALFEMLRGTLAGDVEQASYTQVAGALGMSPGAVKVAAHRLRGRYRELLRAEIAQTVECPEDVDDEIRLLLTCLE